VIGPLGAATGRPKPRVHPALYPVHTGATGEPPDPVGDKGIVKAQKAHVFQQFFLPKKAHSPHNPVSFVNSVDKLLIMWHLFPIFVFAVLHIRESFMLVTVLIPSALGVVSSLNVFVMKSHKK